MSARNVIIIGSGPAGLTAAIYAARAGLNPLLFEGEMMANNDLPGGQLMTTSEVENYPGFAEGVSGPELVAQLRRQAERFGAEVVGRRVTRVDLSTRPFVVESGEDTHLAESVIISTGARPNMLPLEGIWEWSNRGLSTCATCDGFFYRGKDVALVGGGDSALEEALFLANHADSITIIHRRAELRASKIMQDRARANPKIRWRLGYQVERVSGAEKISSVTVSPSTGGPAEELQVQGLFVAIGHTPNTDLFREQLALDEAGHIVTDSNSQATSIEGVFACGDVQDPTYRQAITSAGTGCRAALDAQRYVESLAHITV